MNKKVVFLPYDMDTAIGTNNEGALVYGYSLEDTDHIGVAEVFNGQSSVLWCNLRETFSQEIKDMYMSLRASGNFNYAEVERRFEEHQAKWPEAIFNEDAFAKYIDPLIQEDDGTYLSMLLGSKAEQRKWWLYNRFRYMDSKYNSGDSLSDRILLRGNAVASITLTPYADIYASIRWGSTLKQQRATRNVAYTMPCALDSLGDTDIYVYSAGQMASLGDLSPLMLSFADFHSGTHLQNIIIGSADPNYDNQQLRSISIGGLKLLKKIDVRNCSALGTANANYAAQKSVDLSGCLGIEEAYFDGTNIASVTLPNGGFLKKLHLPATVTNLTIKNQTRITEFVCPDYSNITTLNLENSLTKAQIETIVTNMVQGGWVRLFGYRWDFANMTALNSFLDLFDGMKGLDQNGQNTETAQLIFTAHVPSATGDEIDAVIARYPYVTVNADVANYYLRYYDTEGNTLLYTETVAKNQNGTWVTQPSKASDAQYTYSFVGWSTLRNSSQAEANARNNITANKNVYAAYTRTVRTYTVTFVRAAVDGGGTLQTLSNVPYGTTPAYTGSTPTSTNNDGGIYTFEGWTPEIGPITGNTTYTAKFIDANSPVVKYLNGTMTSYTSGTDATKAAQYAFYNMTTLTSVETYATTIEANAFNGCTKLETLDLKAASGIVSFTASAVTGCTKLMAIFIRSSDTATLSGSLPAQFSSGKGVIYVPTAKVDTYKAASGWSTYASHIFSIDEYPVTNFDTIKDTLSEMCTKLANGTANYNVGDFKTIDLGTEGEIRMQVAAKNVDELSTGGSNAAYTWVAMDLLNTNNQMNPLLSGATEGTGTIGGWGKSEMRTYLSTTIWALIPAELQAVIKEVKKYSCIYDTSGTKVSDDVSNDKLWIPSAHEVFNNTTYETQGPSYTGIFTDNSNRKRYKPGASSAIYWWERSAHSTSNFRSVNNNGYDDHIGSTNRYSGVLLGFCT